MEKEFFVMYDANCGNIPISTSYERTVLEEKKRSFENVLGPMKYLHIISVNGMLKEKSISEVYSVEIEKRMRDYSSFFSEFLNRMKKEDVKEKDIIQLLRTFE